MPANDFAIPRMEAGKQRPILSMEEARDGERLFFGEIKAGRDPGRRPTRAIHVNTQFGDVSAFLDAYLEASNRSAERAERKVRHGTRSSFGASTCAGTT